MFTKRILAVVFIILVLITTGELAFYLHIKLSENSLKPDGTSPSPVITATDFRISPTVNPVIAARICSADLPPEANTNLALNNVTLTNAFNNLKFVKKGVLGSSLLTNRYQGIITDIEKTEGVALGKLQYFRRLAIKGDGEGNVPMNLAFTQDEYRKLVVTETGGKPINFDDLKNGDTINYSEIIDLSKNLQESMTELKIVRLSAAHQ